MDVCWLIKGKTVINSSPVSWRFDSRISPLEWDRAWAGLLCGTQRGKKGYWSGGHIPSEIWMLLPVVSLVCSLKQTFPGPNHNLVISVSKADLSSLHFKSQPKRASQPASRLFNLRSPWWVHWTSVQATSTSNVHETQGLGTCGGRLVRDRLCTVFLQALDTT